MSDIIDVEIEDREIIVETYIITLPNFKGKEFIFIGSKGTEITKTLSIRTLHELDKHKILITPHDFIGKPIALFSDIHMIEMDKILLTKSP